MKKIKIAEDTPKELIELFKKIDLSKIPESEHDSIIESLKKAAKPFIPLRPVGMKVKPIEIDLPGCPQRLATVVSQFDFVSLGSFKKKAGLRFMKSYLKKHNLLKV
jgi:hypothetical protein